MMPATFQGFRHLIENNPDAISLVDRRGSILYGNGSTARILGYQPEELLGRNCLELIHPEDRDDASRALQDVMAKPPRSRQWDARVLRKDGNFSWVQNTVSNFLSEAEVRAIVVQQRDISDRKAAEAERQRSVEELARSNARLEAFAHTAAHDLREPLRAIRAYSQKLARTATLDEETLRMFGFIVDGAERMSVLIDDLLTFAGTGVHQEPSSFDLQDALVQAMEQLAPEIQKSGATFSFSPLPRVKANEIHLVRLFQNLIGNAMKYRRRESVKISVTATREGSNWIIRIEDNGQGIATDDYERIFLPFVRLADRTIPGTGLGLAVCRKIVEAMGGRIWVESKLAVGSTFAFVIAAADESVSGGAPGAAPQVEHCHRDS
jgi:PAS domain S-box-containing protein